MSFAADLPKKKWFQFPNEVINKVCKAQSIYYYPGEGANYKVVD